MKNNACRPLQMPDGRVARFEVPEGTSPEQAQTMMEAHFASTAAAAPAAPERGTVPAEERSVGGFLSNVGTSAGKLVGGLAEAVTSPVKTVGGILDIGAGALQKALPKGLVDFANNLQTPEAQEAAQRAVQTANAVGGMYAQRYGSAEGLKKTLYEDPVGAAADLSALFTGGAGAVKGLAGAARAVPAATRLAPAAEATANALSTAARYTNPLQPVGKAVNALGSIGGGALQTAAGFATGRGKEAFKDAYTAGKEGSLGFVESMRGKVPVEQVLDDAKRGLSNIQNDMSAAYATAKTGWAADTTPLDFSKIDTAFAKLEASTQHAGKSLIGKDEATKIAEVRSVLDEWRADPTAHTALGLDALKRRVDAIYPDNPRQSQAQRVISGTRNAVKDVIQKQVPEYAAAMKGYEEGIGMIREIEKGLSLGDKASKTAALQKLQSLVKNKPFDKYRQELISKLEAEGGVSLAPTIAGQSLSEITPSGLGKLGWGMGAGAALMGSPKAMLALPLTSPRLMGEAFYGAGRLANAKNALLNKTNLTITPEQINFINALTANRPPE
ncbi:MAG: hypothetical protein EHM17_11590 [Verrucomicrobiaceae bacterium]|nr:MAG: hypothetical protein EHM17_11590 [Verrucomicrobiaceae bacterium]